MCKRRFEMEQKILRWAAKNPRSRVICKTVLSTRYLVPKFTIQNSDIKRDADLDAKWEASLHYLLKHDSLFPSGARGGTAYHITDKGRNEARMSSTRYQLHRLSRSINWRIIVAIAAIIVAFVTVLTYIRSL